MTENLESRCRTPSHSGRMVGKVRAPIAFPAVILLHVTVMLVFGTTKAQAALTLRDTNGTQICRFEENGDLYLSGVLVQGFGYGEIPSPAQGAKCWRVTDSSSEILMLLALEELTLDDVTYYPGDMILAGTVSGHSSLSGDYLWRLKDTSSNVVAQLTPDGDLQLRYTPDQQKYVSDKVFTNSSLAASITSDRFKFDPGDLDYLANKADGHSVWDVGAGNDRPTSTCISGGYPYWYDQKESWHGGGDLWATTWVKNDASKPVLLMANGDQYGLSYRRFVGTSLTTPMAYQRIGTSSYITPYPISAAPYSHWYPTPTVAISRFSGSPGNLGWPIDTPLDGPGETIARLLRSYDPVTATGEFQGGYDFSTSYTIPNIPAGQYGAKYRDDANYINSHSYRTPRELKPTGLIHFDDGSTSGVTYMACQDHNPNYPVNFGNDDYKSWEPTAAAQHVYIFKSTDQGVTWTPTVSDGANNLARLDLASNRRVWTDFKFTTPVFCQFGMAYGDYEYAFPDEYTTTKYLYAFSPHERWWNQDNLYLGRVAVYYSSGWHTDDIQAAANWKYWVGTDKEGQPIWDSSVSKAAPILHAKGEIAQPSVIYQSDSRLYFMTTFSNSGNNTLDGWPNENICPDSLTSASMPVAGKVGPHWILWQAPQPWGPWKKVFTNDYNGLQTDYLRTDAYGHKVSRKGFMGYTVQIMPAWISQPNCDELEMWVAHAGFRNFFGTLDPFEFEVGDPPQPVTIPHPHKFSYDWLEGYTLEFSQITLSQRTKPISASLSPMYQHEQNDTVTSSTAQFTVGYHFRLSENRTVTHLGRYFVTGNTGTHTLKIVAVSVNGSSTTATLASTLASVSLDLGDFDPDQMDELGFVYAELGTPVQLSANTDYLLLSSEGGSNTEGYFGWRSQNKEPDPDSTPEYAYFKSILDLPEVSTGRVLQILHAATQESLGNTWILCNSVSYPDEMYDVRIRGVYGNSFGGVNLLLQQDSVPYAMHSAAWVSPPSFNSERLVGTRFIMGQEVIVSALGRMKVNNNSKVHEVRLMWVDSGTTYTTIASVPIRMYSTTDNNTYVYRDLGTPVRLESGETYVLVSREFSGVSEDYCGLSGMSLNPNVFSSSTACWFQWTNNSVGTKTDGASGQCYGGVNLKYY